MHHSGIDGESRGECISEEGDFECLGRVAYGTIAAANILLKARLLDAGNTVPYNQSKDEYHLEHQRNYTFGRKILSDGRRSSQYACDMAAADHTFVTTVADNMRQYTKREVAQARNARELIARLGYPSSKTTIDMLDAGIFKCDITKQDVRNADAIFGSCIPSLKEKTHKRASTPASAVTLPRVTQVQQMLAVDLFFTKKIPFLLGELVSFGLAQCIPIKNRTAEVIASSIRSIINTARNRDFDCVQLRTDGEGALAAMSQELNGLDIVLDVAGPGQHVPIIENKIKTIKERVRAHENGLPYVMTRLLTTMCVLFCVLRLDMQPSRVSVDQTSHLEQFTGRKIDATRDLRI